MIIETVWNPRSLYTAQSSCFNRPPSLLRVGFLGAHLHGAVWSDVQARDRDARLHDLVADAGGPVRASDGRGSNLERRRRWRRPLCARRHRAQHGRSFLQRPEGQTPVSQPLLVNFFYPI